MGIKLKHVKEPILCIPCPRKNGMNERGGWKLYGQLKMKAVADVIDINKNGLNETIPAIEN